MKKRIFLIKAVSLILLLSLLAGCGELIEATGNPSEAITHEEATTTDGSAEGEENGDQFTVSLMYAGSPYIPKIEMGVRWSDGKSVHEAQFGEDGIARISDLDGDYQVTLTALPKNFTYNPNVYVATNDSKNVIIELFKYKTAKRGGADIYNCISVKDLGIYRTELKNSASIVYYEFQPRQSGTYTIESWVDVTANVINPQIDFYNGTIAAKFFERTIDDGGISSTYTKNFKMTIEIDEQMIGGVYTFGVKVLANDSNFPVSVDFAVQLNGGFSYPWGTSDIVVPTQLDSINWKAINELRGGSTNFVGAEKKLANGSYIFDTDEWGYDEELGCYRKINPVTGIADGPVLYAYVAAPCRFIDEAFSTIEYRGNKALTVNGGTEDYKLFIEGYAALIKDPPQLEIGPYFCVLECPCRVLGTCDGACAPGCAECSPDCRNCPEEGKGTPGYAGKCNEIGVVPVTPELKDFLQKFSISQKLYCDGNGWVEENPTIKVDAGEDDQWLFACGYYA